jgi:predicted MPP superfamily phosphohydrolase
MRKLLFSALFVILSLSMILVMRVYLPKYSGMLLSFFFFLLFAGYLWYSVRIPVKRLSRSLQVIIAMIFWLPFGMLVCLTIFGLFVPFTEWNIPFRTYLQNFILILFLAEVFPMLALVLADLTRLVKHMIWRMRHREKPSLLSFHRSRTLLVTGWALGALLFLAMVAGTVFWQFDFKVRHQTITLNQLPKSFDGLTIAQLSDVHLGSWGVKERLADAINDINNLHPDVIFFTGDMFNYCTADGRGFETILQRLHAPYGVYAIMGNHDYGDYISWPSPEAKQRNFDDLLVFYRTLGWKLLLNSHDFLVRGEDSIAVIGVENWGATKRFQRFGDIAKAQRGTENMGVQLLLSHDPSHWDSIVSKKYQQIDLTFAGHTHGGQVGIDCCNIHWSPVKWISRFWCGLYENPSSATPQYLYVNQGLGNIGYSGRIGILPEITFITLKSQ